IQNVIQIEPDDKVRTYINVRRLERGGDFAMNHYIVMCTAQGTVKKTLLNEYTNVRKGGVNAINIREDDQLIDVALTSGNAEIVLATYDGKAIRFNEEEARAIGRTGTGVRGISIDTESGNRVVGMVCFEPGDTKDILVLSENGFGKRTDLNEYTPHHRGGKGMTTMKITEKTGKMVSIQAVDDSDDLMIINRSGITIRTSVSDIRVAGRATQGVKVINLREGDSIASVTAVPKTEEIDAVVEGEGAVAEGVTSEVATPEQNTTPANENADNNTNEQE
ncbi:MAG: DNA gyrase subunit A, partial [Tidjanibacter sp.]|nr:DNA gyrase subunit A [Tidjanibacter sp.]